MDRTKSIILAALLALFMHGCASTEPQNPQQPPDPASGYVPWWAETAE